MRLIVKYKHQNLKQNKKIIPLKYNRYSENSEILYVIIIKKT